ncbi:MAG TPA: STAS domain-containing protein, partial [Thermomonospora sp.]|nr:STAS domain-containing protein [Thermomonospora sp.]
MHATAIPATGAQLTSRQTTDHLVIELHGELDIASTTALRDHLLVLLRRARTPVVIDLSGVTFCDAAGLSLLVGARRRAHLHDLPIALAAPRPQIHRLL